MPDIKEKKGYVFKILQSFKTLEITDWTSVLHSCRTIPVWSCEPVTLWVTDLVVCIFVVYLSIHAPVVSHHLNWLACHYFPRGWLIVRPKSCSLSGRFPIKRAEITSFFSPTVVQKSCTVAEYKTSDVLQKSPDNGCEFFIWNMNPFYLFH